MKISERNNRSHQCLSCLSSYIESIKKDKTKKHCNKSISSLDEKESQYYKSEKNNLNPKYFVTITVEPPVSDHPKCQANVVAYWGWSLTRSLTVLGQNLASLAYAKLPYTANRTSLTIVTNSMNLKCYTLLSNFRSIIG